MTTWTLGSLFTGTLVRLAAKKADDKEAQARWSYDAEYMRQLSRGAALPQGASFYEEKKDSHHEANKFHFMIRTLAEDKLIGICSLDVAWSNQSATFWIGIGEPDYRGKGYGSDAVRLLVNYAFRELNLYRVALDVFSYNTRAIATYEKLGFVHEGAQRGVIYRDCQRFDMLSMSLLRPEWEALSTAATAANSVSTENAS